MLDVVSLFSGIEGFGLGLERTGGFRVVAQVEQDPFCLDVLEQYWPHVPRFTDVRTVGAHNLPRADVVTGGFPCQDISYAGAGAGLDGERSGLWTEMLRIVRELRPRYLIVENVSALLARGVDVVLGGLAACGYDAEWDCIPASAVGAHHRRDRIWLVAYPHGRGEHAGPVDAEARGAQEPVADPGGERGAVGRAAGDMARAPRADQGQGHQRQRNGHALDDRRADVADTDGERAHGSGARGEGREEPPDRRGRDGARALADAHRKRLRADTELGPAAASIADSRRTPSGPDAWLVEPDVGRVAHGVPARVDRLRALGNALVPQIPEWIGNRILDYEEGRLDNVA